MKNLITCLVVCVLSGATFATTWTVDDDGKADFDNIQAAIDASSDGDEIVVAPGTYISTASEVINMRGKEIWLHSSGGAEVTIIDGEGTRRGILCVAQETSNTIIEGLTITTCWFTTGSGGGMHTYNDSSPTLTNCTFTNNSAEHGGGMCNESGSSPTLTNCTFTNNYASNAGGAMWNSSSNTITLTDCTFTDNTALGHAGAVGNWTNSIAAFTNCTFTGNTADKGGGMSNKESSLTLTNCTFTDNNVDTYGGGMYNDNSSPTLTYTTVCGNTPDQIYGDWIDNGDNTVADECVPDEDGDGVPDYIDNCYLYNPDQANCNGNDVGDVCDIADGTSYDCDQNGVPDECQPDCNGDGLPDPCEPDIDGDGIPDNCETDCNENGWPDEWELIKGYATDCDNNGWLDECDIADGIYEDCDGNGLPDFCDLQDGTHEDCDENDVPDICQFWNDINNNGISDICEVPLATYGSLLFNHCVTNFSGEWFGHNVDIAGDLITISCSSLQNWGIGNQWNIDVYSRDSEGNWAPEFRIDDADLIDNHISTSLDPPFLASAAFSQSVTIYQRVTELEDPTVCDGKARWDVSSTINSPEDLGYFGHAVAIEGDDLAVAAHLEYGGVIEMYGRMQEGNWEQTQRLILSDHISWEPGPPRGLEIENGWLLVSWTGDNSVAGAMVFRKNGKGVYEFHELLDLPIYEDPDFPYDYRGWVTADIDGDRILVEAFDFDDQARQDRCWIFDWNEEAQSWTRSNATFTDGIPAMSGGAHSVISGDVVTRVRWQVVVGSNIYNAISAYRYTQEGWELFSRVVETLEGSTVSSPGHPIAFDEFTLVHGSWGDSQANIITFDADNDGVLDVDQVAMNPEIDSDNTGIPDFAEPDCNGNGIADAHDILQDPSLDEQYPNGIIDDCEVDIDNDGFPDWWEAGFDSDYNDNWVNDWDDGDCNGNGVPDVWEIEWGDEEDNNNDWIPDVCQCLADPSQDGEVGVSDVLIIIATWGETCGIGDTNGDHVIDIQDLLFVVSNWGPCE